jgi:hypothetical protein
VSLTEAQAFAEAMRAADSRPQDRDWQIKVLMTSCSEMASCSGSCKEAFAAGLNANPEMRAPLLSQCKDLVKFCEKWGRCTEQPGQRVDDYFKQLRKDFAGRARIALEGADRDKFDALASKMDL